VQRDRRSANVEGTERKCHKLSICQDAPQNKFLARRGLIGVATLKKQPDLNGILRARGCRIGIIYLTDTNPVRLKDTIGEVKRKGLSKDINLRIIRRIS
jgi:hypothetical protein